MTILIPFREESRKSLEKIDAKLREVYGSGLQFNSGEHLPGGIEDDKLWQCYWRRLLQLPNQLYDMPKGSVAKEIFLEITQQLDSIMARKSNSEKFLTFILVVFQKQQQRGGKPRNFSNVGSRSGKKGNTKCWWNKLKPICVP